MEFNSNETNGALEYFPVCEESPQLGVSRPYNKDHNEGTK
jgi:hypothetical protein